MATDDDGRDIGIHTLPPRSTSTSGGQSTHNGNDNVVTDYLNVREDEDTNSNTRGCRSPLCRNLTGFWLLGLCNNYAYVVMLSAAYDILAEQESDGTENMTVLVPAVPVNRTRLIPHCGPIGTGAVLLADILPAFLIKLTAPFFIQSIPYWTRVTLLVGFPAIASFLVVAFSSAVWMSLLGVVLASISSGVGEITFLAMSSHFDRNVLSTWSSGTGGAGVFGALSYTGLIAVGLTARRTLQLMVIIPVILILTYFFLLVKSSTIDAKADDASTESLLGSSQEEHKQAMERGKYLPLTEKFKLIKPLLPLMVPLGMVYFSEYFINQGLTELVEFENIWLTLAEQYRWYSVIYQVGVFISRSSANIVRIRKIWILAILQALNIVVLMLQIFFSFAPVIWIMFCFILYEGLLGGAAYVNTFYIISETVSEQHREYSLGVASVADSTGIVLAGLIAVPTELVEFENIWLTLAEQYRWYSVIYQVGVFISRSSANIVRIRKIWILAILQALNIVVLMLQIFFSFAPVIWIMFCFILYEGLLGGAAYVNTFYIISETVSEQHREYSLGVASVADSTGIVLAGLIAVPVHNYLCGIYV